MRRLLLVRHGESIYNAEGRVQGQVCAGLSELGHAQARAAGASLAAAHPDAVLVASDMRRAVETSAPLAAALGREPELDPRLRERAFGIWEERLRDDIIAQEPERWDRFAAGESVLPEIGGEDDQALGARVVPALTEWLEATPADGTTIAVLHGGPIWHGIHALLELRWGVFGGVANASMASVLAFGDGGLVVDGWNETGHLPVELRSGERRRAASDTPPATSAAH